MGILRGEQRKFCLQELDIRSNKTVVALPEQRHLASVVAWSERLLVLPDTGDHDVILKVLPHTWQMLNDRDVELLQFSFIPDAGLHEQLRRVDASHR
jgi:hypothetical protein